MADQSYLLTFLSGATSQLEEPFRHELKGNMWMHAGAVHTMISFNRARMCQAHLHMDINALINIKLID